MELLASVTPLIYIGCAYGFWMVIKDSFLFSKKVVIVGHEKVSTKLKKIEDRYPGVWDKMSSVLPASSIKEESDLDIDPPMSWGLDVSKTDDAHVISMVIPTKLLLKPRNDKPTELVIKTKLPSKYILIDTESKKIYQGTEEGGLFKSWKELK